MDKINCENFLVNDFLQLFKINTYSKLYFQFPVLIQKIQFDFVVHSQPKNFDLQKPAS